jgi:hypothetical protein
LFVEEEENGRRGGTTLEWKNEIIEIIYLVNGYLLQADHFLGSPSIPAQLNDRSLATIAQSKSSRHMTHLS